MGPRTDPCGTPMGDWKVEDLELPIETNCRRLERYDRNQERAKPWMPKEVSSLFRKSV